MYLFLPRHPWLGFIGVKMKTKDLFNDKSDLYSKSRPYYPSELFALIKDKSNGYQKAWDCATGNGQAAIGLSSIFDIVEATDISTEQIKNKKEKENINYSVSSAEETDFNDSTFDLINVAQALHWFDFSRFWNESSRLLKPNGLFITYSYSWSFVSEEIDQIVREKIRKPIHEYWAPNNQLCWNGYSEVDFPFEKLEVPQFELLNQWTHQQYIDYLHSWSATRRCINKNGLDFFNKASEIIKKSWGENVVRDVRTPLTVICGYNWL